MTRFYPSASTSWKPTRSAPSESPLRNTASPIERTSCRRPEPRSRSASLSTTRHPTVLGGLQARSVPGRRCRRSNRSDIETSGTHTRSRPRIARRRGRPLHHRDTVRSSRSQSRHQRLPPRCSGRRSQCADPDSGDHRADRENAPGNRDRGGPRSDRTTRARRDRSQLRNRTRRDVRTNQAPRRELDRSDRCDPQRRPAIGRRRRHALRLIP